MKKTAATDSRTWDSAVELSHVTKYFDRRLQTSLFHKEHSRVYALKDVSFRLEKGELAAYAGPNGAGKSTTFKILAGMLCPQEGHVRILGLDPSRDRIPAMKRVGVLFGNRTELWWDHPVSASFAWKKEVWDIDDEAYRQACGELKEMLDLNDYSVTYNCRDFLSIEVVCDKDFDEQHPAGASLCDIVRFMSWSPYKYIASGYSKYYNYNAWTLSEAFKELMPIYFSDEWFQESTSATCYPIDKMAKDLTPSDLILLGHNYPGFLGMLYFENGPRQPGEYTITVTLNCDDGYVISNSAKMRF